VDAFFVCGRPAVKSPIFIGMIRIEQFDQLNGDIRRQLDQFIHNEFGHIPIVQQTSWATPDWTLFYEEEESILSFYNIIERTILIDGIPVKVAGINNVKTPPAHRGMGYASLLLNQSRGFLFNELLSEHALLLCADAMIPYYEKLGWYKAAGNVYFEQPLGRRQWTANTMLLSPSESISPTEIDLQGLPW